MVQSWVTKTDNFLQVTFPLVGHKVGCSGLSYRMPGLEWLPLQDERWGRVPVENRVDFRCLCAHVSGNVKIDSTGEMRDRWSEMQRQLRNVVVGDRVVALSPYDAKLWVECVVLERRTSFGTSLLVVTPATGGRDSVYRWSVDIERDKFHEEVRPLTGMPRLIAPLTDPAPAYQEKSLARLAAASSRHSMQSPLMRSMEAITIEDSDEEEQPPATPSVLTFAPSLPERKREKDEKRRQEFTEALSIISRAGRYKDKWLEFRFDSRRAYDAALEEFLTGSNKKERRAGLERAVEASHERSTRREARRAPPPAAAASSSSPRE
jgi:hypothetical protein